MRTRMTKKMMMLRNRRRRKTCGKRRTLLRKNIFLVRNPRRWRKKMFPARSMRRKY